MNSKTSSNTLFPKQKANHRLNLLHRLKLWIRQDIVADDPWNVDTTYFPEEDLSEVLHQEPAEE